MTDNERIVVLETNQARLQEDLQKLYKFIRDHMKTEDERWEEITNTLIKQKGFVGGVVFVITSIVTVISFFINIWNKTS